MGISSIGVSCGFFIVGVSSFFRISSWRCFSSSSEACLFVVSSPYIGRTSSRAWSIILSSLILMSWGLNLFWSFFEIS